MEKINIAELLKDCPQGMELDCALYENLEFDHIDEYNEYFSIICRAKTGLDGYNVHTFTEHGCYSTVNYAKCVIYPKGKTTWEGFHRPFKDGDIVVYDNPHRDNLQVFIFKSKKENNTLSSCYLMLDGDELDLEEGMYYVTRLATEEEKQILFDAIKENGYRWNAETKTLEKLIKPKFKVGDKVKPIYNNNQYVIDKITDTHYTIIEITKKYRYSVRISEDKNWELVPSKFDINTLVPFESKVLVRNSDSGFWKPAFWGIYEAEKSNEHQYRNYLTTEGFVRHCIPYNDETKHLVGKTGNCPEYYKTW